MFRKQAIRTLSHGFGMMPTEFMEFLSSIINTNITGNFLAKVELRSWTLLLLRNAEVHHCIHEVTSSTSVSSTLRMGSIHFNIRTWPGPEAYLLIILHPEGLYQLVLFLFMLLRLPERNKDVLKLQRYDRGKTQFYLQMLRYWWKSLR